MSLRQAVRERAGLLAVTGAAVLWGTTGVAVRIVHDRTGLGALPIGWFRLVIAALVIGAVLRPPGMRRARTAFTRHRVPLLVTGTGFGAYQALYFVGVQYVGVSVSTLVSLGVAPVALTIGMALGRRRFPSRTSLSILAAALTGLALISLRPGVAQAPHPLLGLLASVGSGLGYAAITALSRRMASEDPFVLTWITSIVGVIVLLPIAGSAGLALPSDPVALGWLAYIGVVPTVGAYWLFYRGLRTTAPEIAGVVTLLEPVTAAFVAALVLHESLSSAAIVGTLLLLIAVASLYLRKPVPVPPPPPPP